MHAQSQPDGQPAARQLLDDLQVHLVGLAAAAEPLGIGQAQQARGADDPEQLAREDPVPLGRGGGRAQLLVGQLGGELEEPLRLLVGVHPVRKAHQASTTTSSRVPLLSRSQPCSPQTTMSSILAPCAPG